MKLQPLRTLFFSPSICDGLFAQSIYKIPDRGENPELAGLLSQLDVFNRLFSLQGIGSGLVFAARLSQ